MRKPVLLILTNTAILIVVLAMLAQSLFIVRRVALVRDVSGKVQVQRGGTGQILALGVGENLQSGDVVSTGDASWGEFGWPDGTRWKLAPNSVFVMENAISNPLKRLEIARFRLTSGQVLMRMVKPMSDNSRFEVETPQARASVRGTIFSVRVASTQTEVKVFAGRVEVSDLNSSKSVTTVPGQRTEVSLLDFKTRVDTNQSEFLAFPDFLRPELKVQAQVLENNRVLLRGQTEAGDAVTINGTKVTVLGTGAFVKQFKAASPSAKWKIESTDKHGAKTSLMQTLPGGSAAEQYPQ